MESVLGRYRNLIVLVLVLFAQVLGLAVQVKRGNANEGQDTRLIRIWAVGALSPFERGLVWIQNSTHNIWHNYFYLRGVRAENRDLKQQIEQMRLEQVRLNEDAAQARRLQNLLGFKEQFIAKTVAAQVIGSSGSDLSRIIYIDKGEDSGVKRDMAVLTADGIVGKVLLVYPSESQVLLISDQSSGVGALLEKSRLQGVLRGTPNGEITLERVMSDEQVQPGETVLTSGGDQIFPKGLPIGTVTKVAPGKDLFLNIKIKPTADLSKLEEVLVLVEKQERQAVADVHERVRAADILAQRLPSVPDKPVVDPKAPAAANASTNGAKPAPGAVPATTTKPTTGTNAPNKATTGTATQSTTKKPGTDNQPNTQASSGGAVLKPAKPKAVNEGSTQTNSARVQGGAAIVEEKPAAPVTPKPQSPSQDNSPQ